MFTQISKSHDSKHPMRNNRTFEIFLFVKHNTQEKENFHATTTSTGPPKKQQQKHLSDVKSQESYACVFKNSSNFFWEFVILVELERNQKQQLLNEIHFD
jgi:hypothetical protein